MTPRPLDPKDMAPPGTPEWGRTVTASKAASMLRDATTGEYLGIGYDSAFDLWHQMAGTIEKDVTGMEEHFLYGHSVERAARHWWMEKNPGWRVSPGEVAYTDDDWEVPNQITLDMRASRGRRRKIIEVKAPRVDRGVEDKWLVQITMQMDISGIREADLIVWPVFGFPEVYPIEWDPSLASAIRRDATAFYQSLIDGQPPEAGDSEHAKGIFAALHPEPDPQQEYEVPEAIVDTYRRAVTAQAEAESRLKTVENLIMQEMGDAQKATHGGQTLASRRAGRFSQNNLSDIDRLELEPYEAKKITIDSKKLKAERPDLYQAGQGTPSYTFNRKDWSA